MAPWSCQLSVHLEERAVNTYANWGLTPLKMPQSRNRALSRRNVAGCVVS